MRDVGWPFARARVVPNFFAEISRQAPSAAGPSMVSFGGFHPCDDEAVDDCTLRWDRLATDASSALRPDDDGAGGINAAATPLAFWRFAVTPPCGIAAEQHVQADSAAQVGAVSTCGAGLSSPISVGSIR